MPALVWFRSDLRVHDHTALHHACRAGHGVIAIFVISPGQWRRHDYAPARVDLILRTLRELSASLAALNIPLLFAHAGDLPDVPGVVAETARAHGCTEVHFNKEYELDEARRDRDTARLLEAHGIRAVAHTDQTCFEPGSIRTGEGRYYTVFTPFKKAWLMRLDQAGGPGVLPAPAPQPPAGVKASPVPESVDGFEPTPAVARHWPAGESHARRRLAEFIDGSLGEYKSQRDFPAQPGTSRLSPYLAVGAVSPRQCLHAAFSAGPVLRRSGAAVELSPPGPSQWITELIWREFYIHITAGFPRVCMGRAFQPATERLRWSDNEEHFEAWTQGRTGVPIVDAGMRQLLAEGWMQNRVRMIAAMYLTKNLFIDWRRGERWFMRNLVDGFFASNNGGWQWSASTGTDAAPYFRVFNPVSQSRKFDPGGGYIRRYLPELAGLDDSDIHEPWTLPGLLRSQLDYPEPLVDLSATRERAIDAFRAIKA